MSGTIHSSHHGLLTDFAYPVKIATNNIAGPEHDKIIAEHLLYCGIRWQHRSLNTAGVFNAVGNFLFLFCNHVALLFGNVALFRNFIFLVFNGIALGLDFFFLLHNFLVLNTKQGISLFHPTVLLNNEE